MHILTYVLYLPYICKAANAFISGMRIAIIMAAISLYSSKLYTLNIKTQMRMHTYHVHKYICICVCMYVCIQMYALLSLPISL